MGEPPADGMAVFISMSRPLAREPLLIDDQERIESIKLNVFHSISASRLLFVDCLYAIMPMDLDKLDILRKHAIIPVSPKNIDRPLSGGES